MKTAVIITGQVRTFEQVLLNQADKVYRLLENPTFFVSFADEPGAIEGIKAIKKLAADRYGATVNAEVQKQPSLDPEDAKRFEAASYHAGYFRSVPVEGIWRQFWQLAEGFELFREVVRDDSAFDVFVRLRPDLHFCNWWPPMLRSRGLDPIGHEPKGVHVPWWGSYGGIPDRFAYIVGYEAAEQYFNVFHKLNELLAEGCAFHPETMLGRVLERAGVPVYETMDADFITIRPEGDKRGHDIPAYRSRDLFKYLAALQAERGG